MSSKFKAVKIKTVGKNDSFELREKALVNVEVYPDITYEREVTRERLNKFFRRSEKAQSAERAIFTNYTLGYDISSQYHFASVEEGRLSIGCMKFTPAITKKIKAWALSLSKKSTVTSSTKSTAKKSSKKAA